jgi:hypothetical protein
MVRVKKIGFEGRSFILTEAHSGTCLEEVRKTKKFSRKLISNIKI